MNFLDDKLYVQNVGQSWSYNTTDAVSRFEVKAGDYLAGDGATRERSEIATSDKFEFGKTYNISFSMMIEPGAKNTGDWMTLLQIQSTFDKGEAGHSPAFALEMVGEKMRIVTRDSSAAISTAADITYTQQYTDKTNITRGEWYDFKITVKLDPFGGGSLDVWRDGVLLCSYKGALGFNDVVGSYFKEGVYREASDETYAVNFKNMNVSLAGANDYAPVITSDGGGAKAAVTVSENTSAVTTVQATDKDGNALTYSIAGGADASLFAIDASTGKLTFKAAPDYEAPQDSGHDNVYDVTVRASDGVHVTDQAIAITVANANDCAPVITTNGGGAKAAVSIAENGVAVTTVHATDGDGDAIAYSISGGADASLFVIDAKTGALSFKAAPDYEAPKDVGGDNIYDVIVRASDGSHLTDQALAISVTDVKETSALAASTSALSTASALSVSTSSMLSSSTDKYDAKWKLVSTDKDVAVTRQDGGKAVEEHYGANGKLTSATVSFDQNGKDVIEHYDANWKLANVDVVTYGAKTVTEHYDANWKLASIDVFFLQNGKAVEEHYNAQWKFTGADVGTVSNGKAVEQHYDANWHETGDDVFYVKGDKYVTEHYDAGWKFASAEMTSLAHMHAVAAHDPLTGWLVG
ncbi:heparin lyase I family protein [Terrarubrum flagellatum]|uniref:heparin lyase I family protein n=1 Tax=Terrirubrum flagellatum TaxID=2895980 RepID=UPI003145413D